MGAELCTNAEKLADQSRSLPNFKNVSLPGIKEQVAQVLDLIGRDGIFSTYTVHNISHIDAMLRMLDWLVPESTKGAMTSADWLLLVLSIYLHDLGMVTTTQEFEGRSANPEFTSWRNSLGKTTEGQEYIARTNRMNADEKERFFFQEFIRKGHAQRIREWITGRPSRKWGPQIEPIAKIIATLLNSAPSRFREYLGIVCESHHESDLDKLDKYPLAARLGNDQAEIVNVQYAGILLRSADLLHVTKDRTPSVMYEAIMFSDPKSVEEWDKQLTTFAVGPKGRKLLENDPESAVIVVSADFKEERPLFSLQEYIAYADTQIKDSKRVVDASRESPDGEGFTFPWHEVRSDVRLEGVPPQSMRFELDRGRLLDLLVGHTIYNVPTVAVRELLQNAIDAVRYQSHLNTREAKIKSGTPPPMGKVSVTWNPNERQLSVQDDGVGMTRDVIQHHLMNVGSSYYNTPQFEAEHKDFAPISRFGIGILTCFMISDDVEIVTFSRNRGFRIKMTSVKSTYLLRELAKDDPLVGGITPNGTRVSLRVRDTVDLSQTSVLDIVKHWIILPECTVEYREQGKTPIKIGFPSVQDALKEILKELPPISWASLETIVKSHVGAQSADAPDGGRYELAFGVYSGYYPERSFATLRERDSPQVCIEGIRVAESLPGFERSPERIGGLLSVRGSRRFRTTVSREGLEADEAYKRVSRQCAAMLFEHVSDESVRISQKPGKPLSQAATGAQYLNQQILRAGTGGDIHTDIKEMANSQPSIVIERVETSGDERKSSRTLISPHELRSVPFFWTLESRSVDSLGTISMDLGRELSLNEFLLALAPDVTQLLQYSPMIPDAHRSKEAIRSSHRPDQVEFSRKHQLTAIRWEQKLQGREFGIDLNTTLSRARLDSLAPYIREVAERTPMGLRLSIDVEVARLSGDDPEVMAVSSRTGAVLQDGSILHQTWATIRTGLLRLAEQAPPTEVVCALSIANAFSSALAWRRERQDQFGSALWRERISEFKSILANLKIAEDLPGDLRDRVTRLVVFDATSFWRDWDRMSGF
jgi:molecular chaperone HtpG